MSLQKKTHHGTNTPSRPRCWGLPGWFQRPEPSGLVMLGTQYRAGIQCQTPAMICKTDTTATCVWPSNFEPVLTLRQRRRMIPDFWAAIAARTRLVVEISQIAGSARRRCRWAFFIARPLPCLPGALQPRPGTDSHVTHQQSLIKRLPRGPSGSRASRSSHRQIKTSCPRSAFGVMGC